MTNYYIEKDNKIVLFDKDRQKLINTLSFTPQYEPFEILETERPIVNFQFADTEEYEQEQAKKERERLDNLSMTRGDVFEALILAKGLGKAQVRTMIENAELDVTTKLLYLNRFDEALEFYRGYPIFDLLGAQLDITPQMLDEFFETKDYKKLVKVEEDNNTGEASDETSNEDETSSNPPVYGSEE